jgi:circadian clock protein KaiC
MRLDHAASKQFVTTGVNELDRMLSNGKGVYRGSSVLITGAPGTGKSSLAAAFSKAACERGERALLFAYEESAAQLIRNMSSIGMDLNRWVSRGLLQIHASRPTLQGLEQHLVVMHNEILAFKPSVVVVDPISNLSLENKEHDVKPTLMRLIDIMKNQQITSVFTSLTTEDYLADSAKSEVGVSSLMDTWILIKNTEHNGERNRTMLILKSRGMAHSNQVREFIISSRGIDLIDPYLGTDRVLTGTARVVQTEQEAASALLREQEREREIRELDVQRRTLQMKIEALQSEAVALEHDAELFAARNALQDQVNEIAAQKIAKSRSRRDSNGKAGSKRR